MTIAFWRCVLVAIWLPVIHTLVTAITAHIDYPAAPIIQSILLLALAVPLVQSAHWASTRLILRASLGIGGAAILFFALGASLSYSAGELVSIAGLTVTVAACTEELVFRVLLPQGLRRSINELGMRRFSCQSAVIVSQLVFAVCHFLPGSMHSAGRLAPMLDGLRLLTVGLLLWTIVQIAGVWIAAALHAYLNFNVLALQGSTLDRPASVITALMLSLCIALYYSRNVAPRRPDAGLVASFNGGA